jgi:hypothetical protein
MNDVKKFRDHETYTNKTKEYDDMAMKHLCYFDSHRMLDSLLTEI